MDFFFLRKEIGGLSKEEKEKEKEKVDKKWSLMSHGISAVEWNIR